jgi:hypothetical protein
MSNLNSSENVKVRVLNNTSTTWRVMLYQADLDITVNNYLIGAWRQAPIAAGGVLRSTMPLNIQVGADDEGEDIETSTKILNAPQKSQFEIFTDDMGALDIDMLSEKNADGTISVTNQCESAKWVKLYKDGAPILSAEIRPDFKESIKIKPKLTLALGNSEVSTAFFDAAQISNKTEADLSNQSYLTYTLTENLGTKKISVDISYEAF